MQFWVSMPRTRGSSTMRHSITMDLVGQKVCWGSMTRLNRHRLLGGHKKVCWGPMNRWIRPRGASFWLYRPHWFPLEV